MLISLHSEHSDVFSPFARSGVSKSSSPACQVDVREPVFRPAWDQPSLGHLQHQVQPACCRQHTPAPRAGMGCVLFMACRLDPVLLMALVGLGHRLDPVLPAVLGPACMLHAVSGAWASTWDCSSNQARSYSFMGWI